MTKNIHIILTAIFYLIAGIYHFINPLFYMQIIPDEISEKEFIVAISGFIEIILAVFLVFKKTRKIAAKVIVIMLLAFLFSIHLPMALDYFDTGNSLFWLAAVRIPIQFVLIFWAYKISKIKSESKF